jgi:hypothetical protein
MSNVAYATIGMGAGLYLFVQGFIWLNQKRLIENIPTSTVRSLAMGLVEVHGAVVTTKTLISPLTKKKCVYFKYKIEHRVRTKNGSHWSTTRLDVDYLPFYLRDKTGVVLIQPTGATVEVKRDKIVQHGSVRYSEWLIAPKDTVYVMGIAQDNPHVDDATAQKSSDDIMIGAGKPFFYISDRQEQHILKRFAWKVIGGIGGGTVLTVISLAWLLSEFGLL